MAYEAKVFRVLIASPSDVVEEREIAVKTIQEWNDLNSSERQIVLLPLRWETHTAPEYGKRPQEVINRQIVDHCDLLIGIFWTRIGSPTGIQDSGTLEEIDRVAASGKPVMLYFSKALKNPDDIDTEQLTKLREFKKKTYPKALVENYSGQVEFRDKLAKHIDMQLRNLLSANGDISGKIESDISIEFSQIDSNEGVGKKITVNTEYFDLTENDSIPDYLSDEKQEEIIVENEDGTISTMRIGSGARANKDYYRDYVDYISLKSMFYPIDFWLRNVGSLGAKDLFIDINISSECETFNVISSEKFNLIEPKKSRRQGGSMRHYSSDSRIVVNKIEGKENSWNATFELNALQPKREICPNSALYFGSKSPCKVLFEATIYADSLPEPIRHSLVIDLKVEINKISAISLLENAGVLTSKKTA